MRGGESKGRRGVKLQNEAAGDEQVSKDYNRWNLLSKESDNGNHLREKWADGIRW